MKYASVFYQIAVIFFKIIHKLVVDKQINVENEYFITYCRQFLQYYILYQLLIVDLKHVQNDRYPRYPCSLPHLKLFSFTNLEQLSFISNHNAC